EYCVGICPLLGSPYLGNVRHFRFGADPGDEYGTHNGRAYSGVLLGLIRKMPRLEELELYAEGLRSKELFALSSLTRLRSLKWYQTSQALRLDVLAENASFGQLRELRF